MTGHSVLAQIKFDPGYIIDNNGVRSDVLIKNIQWRNSPEVITYKTSENAEPVTATIGDISEFGIGRAVKFRRYTVEIDRSSSVLSNLSTSRNPEFREEELMLKVLVDDGAANLYEYESRGLKRYFYQIEGGDVQQLVYKPYEITDRRVNYKQS